jgi:hypothetical protein
MGGFMKWCYVGLLLAFSILFFANRYTPSDPPNGADSKITVAQNYQYINPHIRMDGTYVPGYYRPNGNGGDFTAGNPNPTYFPVSQYRMPYSSSFDNAAYFKNANNPSLVPAPYFYPMLQN